ncbi:hypothetical protein [Umezawaea tangerina]|uniref:hypothetical protein n=1 Tax=Umezawaea tangerina TaxID=84725 RepID=UPI000D072730|nr:hypothetical protein [Umezawaea tangerina]
MVAPLFPLVGGLVEGPDFDRSTDPGALTSSTGAAGVLVALGTGPWRRSPSRTAARSSGR